MVDLMGCFLAAASLQQFVVGPEGAIDEYEVTGFNPLLPFGIAARQRWCNEHAFPSVLESQSDHCFFGGQRGSQFFADVIRILSAEGYGVGNEFRDFLRVMGFFRA